MRTCTIEGCNEKHEALGLCLKHYTKKHNDEYYLKHRKEMINSSKQRYVDNRDKILASTKIRYELNKERIIAQQKPKQKIYRETHKEEKRIYRKKWESNKIRTDINFKLAKRLRGRVQRALSGKIKPGSAVRDLGCSISFLKEYIEDLWSSKMNWNNYGIGKDKWNIDHIKPLSKSNLVDKDQFLEAVHFSNLQPMCHIDNIKKGNKE